MIKVSSSTLTAKKKKRLVQCTNTPSKAFALFPEAVHKAQAELDRVVGPNRLPTWADREALPYVRAIVSESLRWAPVALQGVPHAAARDETYKGYKIPKGTMLMFNEWVLHNTEINANDPWDPREFHPERWTPEETLNEQKDVRTDYENRRHFAFGCGRRVCPGFHLAKRALYTAAARLLWGFDFAKKRDAEGNEIPIDRDAYNDDLGAAPLDYQ